MGLAMAVLLAAQGVYAGYHNDPDVLQGVSMQVRSGRRLVILGPNGSGKSTLLGCLSAALKPRQGQVIGAQGTALTYKRADLRAHRQHVQLVLQDPDDQLFSADVYQDVSFGPMNMGLPEAEVHMRVQEALIALGITDLAERPVHHLSYGQRKRAAIAGALAMRPQVLLLDEPTAGLDPDGVRTLLAALQKLEQQGTTVVMSTHDVGLAWEWADEAALVHAGIVHQGGLAEVMAGDLAVQAGLGWPWQVQVLTEAGVDCAGLALADLPRTAEAVLARVRAS